MNVDSSVLWHIGVAVLGGLAIGLEREWSGKAAGPKARFAGLRTFTLLGLTAGLTGWFWTIGLQGPAMIVLAGLGALIVVAYAAASRRDVDGTTEVAAFVVLVAGVLAGAGEPRLAAGIVAVTALLLVEKRQLHRLVSRLDRAEVRAAARFGVMAAVILPILPEGPFGPLGGVRPRLLWALVLFFSGLSFVGFLARRATGPRHGYAVSGTLGGLVSSTSVTLTFSRLSSSRPTAARALAAGTLGANVVLLPRVLVATAVLAPALTGALWPALVAPGLIGVTLAVLGLRDAAADGAPETDRNPLQLGAAIQMTLLFQVVLFGVELARAWFGRAGLYGTAALLGLVDMDALTVSMAQQVAAGAAAAIGAKAVLVGVLANTCVKLGITVLVGRGAFRPLAATGLALMGVALAAGFFWLPD